MKHLTLTNQNLWANDFSINPISDIFPTWRWLSIAFKPSNPFLLKEAHREEMLVARLMRQSQQERRIAVQLLQARKEKDTIKRNRLIREKQYEDRRLEEFKEAMNREAVSKIVL